MGGHAPRKILIFTPLKFRKKALREDPPENQAILKYESTSTLSDFVYISYETAY